MVHESTPEVKAELKPSSFTVPEDNEQLILELNPDTAAHELSAVLPLLPVTSSGNLTTKYPLLGIVFLVPTVNVKTELAPVTTEDDPTLAELNWATAAL